MNIDLRFCIFDENLRITYILKDSKLYRMLFLRHLAMIKENAIYSFSHRCK